MNLFKILFTTFFLLTMPCYSWSQDNIVQGINFDGKQNFEILINQKPKFKAYILHNPERMVVDIFDSDIDSRFETPSLPRFIGDVRRSKSQGNLRLVFDLKAKVTIHSSSFQKLKKEKSGKILVKISVGDFFSSDEEENQESTKPVVQAPVHEIVKPSVVVPTKSTTQPIIHKEENSSSNSNSKQSLEEIIIDVSKDDPVPKPANSVKYVIKKGEGDNEGVKNLASVNSPSVVAKTANSAANSTAATSSIKTAPKKIPIIAIDAGHGGKDPGTIGDYARTKEKFITLSYARALGKNLADTKNYKVYLIRDADEFVPLKRRVEKARRLNADLFISLHANSAADSHVSGFSIYTLSEKSSDKQAELLAQKENRADIIAGVNFGDTSGDILKTLIDLSQRSSMNSSAQFANIAIKSVKNSGVDILHNTHRFAGFMVLTAPDMTSVLIELGYLSNRTEEAKLNSMTHKRNVVKGLVDAIDEYFKVNHHKSENKTNR